MNLGYELKLEQKQKLYITNELKQALNILQLPMVELREYIENAVMENPLLDVKESSKEDFEWEKYFEQQKKVREENYIDYDSEDFSIERFVKEEKSLLEFLFEQLVFFNLDEKKRMIAEGIIGNLDSAGYLRIDLEDLSRLLKCDEDEVINVLKIIQSFDPPGIGARNLKECLLLQINRYNTNDLVIRIIEDHLEDVASNRIMKMAETLKEDLQNIQEAVDIIRSLNPKPGASMTTQGSTNFVIPDIYLEEIDGEFIVIVNDTLVPRLMINNQYQKLLSTKNDSSENSVLPYIEEKLNKAKWLIKNIEQRRLTLYKVTRYLVDYQREFLKKGIKFLKPLTLKEVALELEIHESTVSRAISNKYIQTPRGVYELRSFFSNNVSTQLGESCSKETIKVMLKELIEKENPKKPYSDQQLADLLSEKGLKVARRTVSKYREELGILNTQQRKRF